LKKSVNKQFALYTIYDYYFIKLIYEKLYPINKKFKLNEILEYVNKNELKIPPTDMKKDSSRDYWKQIEVDPK